MQGERGEEPFRSSGDDLFSWAVNEVHPSPSRRGGRRVGGRLVPLGRETVRDRDRTAHTKPSLPVEEGTGGEMTCSMGRGGGKV